MAESKLELLGRRRVEVMNARVGHAGCWRRLVRARGVAARGRRGVSSYTCAVLPGGRGRVQRVLYA